MGLLLLIVVLAILAIIAFGVGFTVHWLFVAAVVLAVLFVISLVANRSGGLGGRRGARL